MPIDNSLFPGQILSRALRLPQLYLLYYCTAVQQRMVSLIPTPSEKSITTMQVPYVICTFAYGNRSAGGNTEFLRAWRSINHLQYITRPIKNSLAA